MELTKEVLSKIGKALVIEAKQEGYSNGVLDFHNHLLKFIKKSK